MQFITFQKFSWIDGFLRKEGVIGDRVSRLIEKYTGSSLENLISSETLKPLNTEPQIYSLRIKKQGLFFRFFGPRIGNCVYLVHSIKKKTNKIPKAEIETAIRNSKQLIQEFNERGIKI